MTLARGMIGNVGARETLNLRLALGRLDISIFSSIVLAPACVSVSDHCFSTSYRASAGHLHHIQACLLVAESTPVLI